MPQVKGHYRNGRWVRSHYRRPPSPRPDNILGLVIIVLIVLAIAHATG